MSPRSQIVAAARSWLGTPYHHEGDVKGIGVDCGMLLVRLFVDSGLVPPFDPRPYPRDWHLHHSEERYLGLLLQHCQPVEGRDPLPGDIIVWRYGRTFSHGGIVSAWPLVIHAFASEGMVVESDLSKPGLLADPARPVKLFTLR